MLDLKNPIREGYITVPDGPGLGIELDEDVLAEELPEASPLWI
jgi:L-alanine-DL-glutamate epimerase-like enolase superfamily enzyme